MNNHVIQQSLQEIFEDRFAVYGASVLKKRAIPDLEDGLSPSNRRVLFCMSQNMNLGFKKAIFFLGETLSKYHPHGDLSLYDTMVGLAQYWKNEHLFITPQGNVGSIQGKPSAAPRYLELRLSQFSKDVLFENMSDGIVNTEWNFDKTLKVPVYLPSRFPVILNSGLMGIGSGFASDIPIHSVRDIVNATIHKLDNPDADSIALAKQLKGPDFPTRGEITNAATLPKMYAEGRGVVEVRGVIEEQTVGGKDVLVITQIPPRQTVNRIVDQIADLCREKEVQEGRAKRKIPGLLQDKISDIKDHSAKGQTKVVIYPKRDVSLPVLRNLIFENTEMTYSHKYIMNVLSNGEFVQHMPLDRLLACWLDYRRQTVRRIFSSKISSSLERMFVLRALIKVGPHIDEIIELIKKSKDKEECKQKLMKKYDFAEREAQYIVEQQLYKLTSLEVGKYKDELATREKEVEEFSQMLRDPAMIDDYIREDLKEVAAKYGKGERKTSLNNVGKATDKDFVEERDLLVAVSSEGYVFSRPVEELRNGSRGNKGQLLVDSKKGRSIEKSVMLNSHDELFVFTTDGKLFIAQAFQLDVNGTHISNIIKGIEQREVAAFIPVSPDDGGDIILTTSSSLTKRVPLTDFRTRNMPAEGLLSAQLAEGEVLVGAVHSKDPEADLVVISTSRGYASKILVSKLPLQKRPSMGRKMIRIKEKEEVVSLIISDVASEAKTSLLFITTKGKGKMVRLSDLLYKKTESGQGAAFLAIKLNPEDKLRKNVLVGDDEKVVITAKSGKTIKIEAEEVNTYSRQAKGNILMKLNDGDVIASVIAATL